MNNTKQYFYNIEDIAEKIAEQYGDVEVYPDGDYKCNTIKFAVKTLTEVSDPDVNYYEDGHDSIEEYMDILKNRLQLKNIGFIEDHDVSYGEWDCWVNHHGYIKITI